jgi:hypothetical protein
MASDEPRSAGPAQPGARDEPPLRGLSPRQVAGTIHGIDSRLVNIDYDDSTGDPVLIYHFEVAGMLQAFRFAVQSSSLDSIVDLYPEAEACEQELQRRLGIVFQPPAVQG